MSDDPNATTAPADGGAAQDAGKSGAPGPVPYERFVEVVRQKNALADELSTLRDAGSGAADELDTLRRDHAALVDRLAAVNKRAAIERAAAAAGAIDPADVAALLDGRVAVNEDGDAVDADAAVQTLRSEKPAYFRAAAPSGMPGASAAVKGTGVDELHTRTARLREAGDTLGMLLLAQNGGV